MLSKLYLLTARNMQGRKPLEDFTTEALAGVLKLDSDFLRDFCEEIGIPHANYKIETQKFFPLNNSINCFVDLIMESDKYVCFIENKVNSKEGKQQLARYCKVLQENYSGKQQFMRYCTKYREDKVVAFENFYQYTWHDIAKYAKKSSNSLTLDFYHFLKEYNMANNHTLTDKILLSTAQIQDVLITFEHYLDAAKKSLDEIFGLKVYSRLSKTGFSDLKTGRMGYRVRNIIKDDTGYSEMMFSIDLDDPRLNVHIFLSSKCRSKEKFENVAQVSPDFTYNESEGGVAIHVNKSLSIFKTEDDPTLDISNWFRASFQKVDQFLLSCSVIDWNIYEFSYTGEDMENFRENSED